jgi:hypothetical protein
MVFRSGTTSKCPPGVFCVTPGVILLGLLLLAIVFFIFTWPQHTQSPLQEIIYRKAPSSPPVTVNVAPGDDRYSIAPRPERFWNAPVDMEGITRGLVNPIVGAVAPPFNYATQGVPEKYQSYGLVTLDDGQQLPLYGRKTATRSDRFNYYTRTDSYNPVPVPIYYKGRDCQDSTGCEEIFSGEDIRLQGNGKQGKVTMYQYDGPMYFPGIY